MSKQGHTPGPWELRLGSRIHCISAEDGCRDIAQLPAAGALWDDSDLKSKAESIPNAHLVAASPRMYDYILAAASEGCPRAAEIISAINA